MPARSNTQPALVRTEMRVTVALASVFALRMFGLFMLLPVFAVVGADLPGATPALIGMAIGAYGLMQALLQIPFGALSDRFGRRALLVFGLVLFIAGGIVAANAESIYGVIAGRALQGAGAIASVIMALISDVVSEAHRTRAMALIGMSVGGSFILALILGPVLVVTLGLDGLFWLTAGLGGVALLIALRVPAPKVQTRAALGRRERFSRVLANASLMRLNAGILVLHLVMTATFLIVPVMLQERAGLALAQHSLLYLAVLLVGFVGMVPLIILAERRGFRWIKFSAVLLLAASVAGLAVAGDALWHYVVALLLFFVAFNLLEALLPSLVGRAAPVGTKGTSMGVYSTSQFIGVFIGAQLGGVLGQGERADLAFLICVGLLLGWALLVATMRDLPRLDNRVLPLADVAGDRSDWLARLLGINGVLEAVVVEEEGIALLKVDPEQLDEVALKQWSADGAGTLQT